MPVNRLLHDQLLLTCLIAPYALVVLQNAWLHEDAFITYRSIDNLINGYGPTWNTTERVQTFTHPLWFFVIVAAHARTGEGHEIIALIRYQYFARNNALEQIMQ